MLVTHENLKIMLLLSGLFYRRMQNISSLVLVITLTHRSMHYTAINASLKIIIFRRKFVVLFLIFPQNMHCEYLLEMPDIKAVLSSTKQSLL